MSSVLLVNDNGSIAFKNANSNQPISMVGPTGMTGPTGPVGPLVLNQFNLNDYIDSLNLQTRNLNIDISLNTINYLTNNIDLTTISNLGSGMNLNVFTLAFDLSGNLYAGGVFTTAGGVPANYVAKWDGNIWSALGSGTNSIVRALQFDLSGNLYACGEFTTAGGVPANRVAEVDFVSNNVNISVNNKFLNTLTKNQTLSVNVTNTGIPYSSGIVI